MGNVDYGDGVVGDLGGKFCSFYGFRNDVYICDMCIAMACPFGGEGWAHQSKYFISFVW